ncbi:MAG TPA: FAD-dependent oxidoreductase [Actinomycetota bacterium]
MAAVDARIARSYADASWTPFWWDRADRPDPRPALEDAAMADLAIVGGGFTGLWAALQAKEADPSRDVVLLEAERIAFGGSGRNGGFCEASLTHGLPNGIARFPEEIREIERQGRESFEGLEATIRRYGIDCAWEPTGTLIVAREPHELAWLDEAMTQMAEWGHDAARFDADGVRAQVDSPTYLGGVWRKDLGAQIDPARLAWGLARAAEGLGVRIHEGSAVVSLDDDGDGVRLGTARGAVRARRAILGTNAFPPLARQIRRYVVPVYDYVLMTEPLSAAQMTAIGWANRQGLADMANQFHYYRLTDDDRILWGGYDAIYHWRNGVDPRHERREQTYALLARQFFETFPQLEGLRFTHRWAGAIDTCSRFSVFFGRTLGGKVAYAAGYTGLGVGATRWGARVALDLVDGRDTERTRLRMVRKKPIPFPPEPFRFAGIWLTRRALARADRRQGRRGPWLKLLDAVGLGFDS